MDIHTKDKVYMTTYVDRKAHERKLPKWLPLKTVSQNYPKGNQHI